MYIIIMRIIIMIIIMIIADNCTPTGAMERITSFVNRFVAR